MENASLQEEELDEGDDGEPDMDDNERREGRDTSGIAVIAIVVAAARVVLGGTRTIGSVDCGHW